MQTLTARERIGRILKHQSVDRVGLYESFWPETQSKWAAGGHVGADEDMEDHFGFDLRVASGFNTLADLDHQEEIVEETEETRLVRDGNGALLRWWKNKCATPEHVHFLVQDRAGWDRHVRPHVTNADHHRRRIKFEHYRKVRDKCRRQELFFCWCVGSVFELMQLACGHEHLLMAMILDADWVKDMCRVYAQLLIDLLEILFEEEGQPDGMFFCEDMGFKGKPFLSPAMYKEIVWPAHKRLFDYSHSRGLPVIVHSCGYVEPLVPGLIEAGMDCLQVMEVKAGMDLLKLKKAYGDRITLFGGMDARTLESNDRRQVKAELEGKLPMAMSGGGYILQSDHSISDRADYDTYRFFADYGLEMGTYT